MADRLVGRSCLIVGGTGGIGLATARRFLQEGARVAVTGLTPEEADEAERHLVPLGPAWSIAADVVDPADTRRAVAGAIRLLSTKRERLVTRKHGNGPL